MLKLRKLKNGAIVLIPEEICKIAKINDTTYVKNFKIDYETRKLMVEMKQDEKIQCPIPTCKSELVDYDESLGCWECKSCGATWD